MHREAGCHSNKEKEHNEVPLKKKIHSTLPFEFGDLFPHGFVEGTGVVQALDVGHLSCLFGHATGHEGLETRLI